MGYLRAMTERDRRQRPRVDVWIPALLTVVVPDQPQFIQQRPVTVVDLNERGAMVTLNAEEGFCTTLLRENRTCRLSFGPSSGFPEQIVGRVVWAQAGAPGGKQACIGLFFEHCPPDVREAIRLYLAGASPFAI